MSSSAMNINGVAIDDTFAEAFGMSATGVIITADNAQNYYDTNIKAEPKLDWNDIWGRVSGQIQYE